MSIAAGRGESFSPVLLNLVLLLGFRPSRLHSSAAGLAAISTAVLAPCSLLLDQTRACNRKALSSHDLCSQTCWGCDHHSVRASHLSFDFTGAWEGKRR